MKNQVGKGTKKYGDSMYFQAKNSLKSALVVWMSSNNKRPD